MQNPKVLLTNITFKQAPKATAEPALPLPLPLETSAVSEAAR
jgi:hypothetical protein